MLLTKDKILVFEGVLSLYVITNLELTMPYRSTNRNNFLEISIID